MTTLDPNQMEANQTETASETLSPPYGQLNMVFDAVQNEQPPADPASDQSHLAALPTPEALSAQQFMPVLPPAELETYLSDVQRDIQLIDDEAQRSDLLRRARVLDLGVRQYEVNYNVTYAALTRALAETGVGVRQSWSRQEQHLKFMNDSSSASERAYTQATEAIEQATQQRFDALIEQGVSPYTRDADDLYGQAALASLAKDGQPYRPEPDKSLSAKAFSFFAVFSKFFVGLISGISINLLFNPDNLLYMTIIALSAGVMFSVLLLWLLEELAYRTQLSKNRRSAASLVTAILLISSLYLVVEGYLNWDGILRVTQQLAANAAQSSTLQDLSSPSSDVPTTPQHWSLLAFTVSLVSMAIGAALIQGRNRAHHQQEDERLSRRVADLKTSGDLRSAAHATTLPALLEDARSRIQPPRDISSPKHAKLNERVLNWWEKERDTQISELSSAIVSEAQGLQKALETLAQDVQRSRFPKTRRGLAGLF
ncbi:hypothetical protein [Deinococcus detaillensis]|nr:hypothetical protein [Deinococcus detaillensis]